MMLSYECSFLQTKFLDLCFKKLNLSVILWYSYLWYFTSIYIHTHISKLLTKQRREDFPLLCQKSLFAVNHFEISYLNQPPPESLPVFLFFVFFLSFFCQNSNQFV